MNPIYVPAGELEDWRKLLAEPDKHWRENYSAMSVAKAWHEADGFPPPVAAVFRAAGEPFASLQPLLIIPEHKVTLPGGNRASQNDVWVLARHNAGLASITVEGKVSESFGETLGDWLRDASPGKHERLRFLTSALGLSADLPSTTRYQLLHRAASALMEAERFNADVAVMLVHSFSDEDVGFADFKVFIELFGATAPPNRIVRLSQSTSVRLFAAWVRHSWSDTEENSSICP